MTFFNNKKQEPKIFGIDFFFWNASVEQIENISAALKVMISYTDLQCASWKIYSDEWGVVATAMHEPHCIEPSTIPPLLDLAINEAKNCVSLYNQAMSTNIMLDGIEFYCHKVNEDSLFGSSKPPQI